MRFLILSISCFLVIGCTSFPKKNNFQANHNHLEKANNPYFSNAATDYVYKASINAFHKNFSGLLIIKKISEKEHRVVFSTEMGTTLFDFSIYPKSYMVHHIIAQFDRKLITKMLYTDFNALTHEQPQVINTYSLPGKSIVKTHSNELDYYYFYSSTQLEKIVGVKHQKEKIEFIFSEINDNIANRITVQHKNIPLIINLTAIF